MTKLSSNRNRNLLFLLFLTGSLILLFSTNVIRDSKRIDALVGAYDLSLQDFSKKFGKNYVNATSTSSKSDPEVLCNGFLGKTTDVMNCLTGNMIVPEKFSKSWADQFIDYFRTTFSQNNISEDLDRARIWKEVYENQQNKLALLMLIRDNLGLETEQDNTALILQIQVDKRVSVISDRLSRVSQTIPSNNGQRDEYKDLFLSSLALSGMTYSETSGKFKKVSWGIGRVLEDGEEVRSEYQRFSFFKSILPIIILFPVLFILYWFLDERGRERNIYLGSLAVFFLSSLYMTLDAANNYGMTSSTIEISPFIKLFERQIVIVLFGYSIIFISMFYFNSVNRVLQKIFSRQKIITLIGVLFAVAGYSIYSSAVGAEIMKTFVAGFAAIITAKNAREIYLVSKYSKESLSMQNIITVIFKKRCRDNLPSPSIELTTYVLKVFSYFLLLSFSLIIFSTFVFNDFGGMILVLLVIVILVTLVFGAKLLLVWTLGFIILASGLSLTEKVSQRITLMIEPMSAQVSDFARLLNFDIKNEPFFFVGTSWCSDSGICVPLQILSDYIPILFEKSFGLWAAVALLFMLTMLYSYIALKTFFIFLTGIKNFKVISIFIFYLSCGTLIQVFLSFLGNWRIIPLSGVSIPYLSIGFTATVIPCLIFGLFLGLITANKNGNDKQ